MVAASNLYRNTAIFFKIKVKIEHTLPDLLVGGGHFTYFPPKMAQFPFITTPHFSIFARRAKIFGDYMQKSAKNGQIPVYYHPPL